MFQNYGNRAEIMRITHNELVVVAKEARRSLQKISYIYNVYIDSIKYIYLYRLVIILPSHGIISKQK